MGRSILLWLLNVPIPIIIIIALCTTDTCVVLCVHSRFPRSFYVQRGFECPFRSIC